MVHVQPQLADSAHSDAPAPEGTFSPGTVQLLFSLILLVPDVILPICALAPAVARPAVHHHFVVQSCQKRPCRSDLKFPGEAHHGAELKWDTREQTPISTAA